ncbi:Plasmodium exported protein, unknown function [Plasmodium chabaudi chabaudi]|uniref:Uncharacterized protein n=1 Tax=Plasmodium chabaudi chabaudi TaxID=31271 RepID=A0A077XD89_PLACU|nr:Plasmodium exported protein, unknown function [Plasmodium chabaudi chabaudi]SCL88919.1 Plasmodium exported protein, unknown function [Plasmodium chabaudi chabaudi]SCL89503.1 Plasmodium exported protein, unknown function [Plasmodium chabaudi chabaudi]VTZ68984.1 Plasmodium exported protein, unknown function [Plasmodium chabaudi chabaudi]|eukprot:XP_016655456.1 Plasmodium exported protein, unknown function [Plasmodium chabaudi chabaudi]
MNKNIYSLVSIVSCIILIIIIPYSTNNSLFNKPFDVNRNVNGKKEINRRCLSEGMWNSYPRIEIPNIIAMEEYQYNNNPNYRKKTRNDDQNRPELPSLYPGPNDSNYVDYYYKTLDNNYPPNYYENNEQIKYNEPRFPHNTMASVLNPVIEDTPLNKPENPSFELALRNVGDYVIKEIFSPSFLNNIIPLGGIVVSCYAAAMLATLLKYMILIYYLVRLLKVWYMKACNRTKGTTNKKNPPPSLGITK